MDLKMFLIVMILSGICFFMTPHACYAYIDPGAGSFVVEMLIAVVVGGLFALKIFWQKVKRFFSPRKPVAKGPHEDPQSNP